jgi:hypothetical protein
MRSALQIAVESLPVERVPAEVVVVTHFESDRPLRGEAGRVDWRLCGMLSDLLASGRLRGAAGDAALLPTFGRLRTPRVLVLGLGAAAGFGAVDVKNLARVAVVRLARLRVTTAALALPGHWTGLLPAGPGAGAVVRGAVVGLEETGTSLRLRLLVPEGAAARAAGGVDAAIRQLGETPVSVQLSGGEPGSLVGARGPASPVRAESAPAASRAQTV